MHIRHVRHRDAYQVLRLVWPFVAVVLVLVGLALATIEIMSSLRAYIAAESVWSKHEKDATFFLHLYAERGDALALERHVQAMDAMRHLRTARELLDQPRTDMDVAMNEAVQGGFMRSDVESAAWVYRIFRGSSYLREPMDIWKRNDAYVDQLAQVALLLRRQFDATPAPGGAAPVAAVSAQEEIRRINDAISPLSLAFSYELSETFRTTALLLFMIDLLAASILLQFTIWHVQRLVIQRRLTEEALRRSEARAKATLGSIGEAVIATNLAGRIEFINPAAQGILRTHAADCYGLPFSDAFSLLYENSRQPETLLANLAKGGPRDGLREDQFVEMILVLRNGTEVNVRAVVSPINSAANPGDAHATDGTHDRSGADRRPDGYVIILRNMTREREYTRSLAWQASHDSLTGLVNRTEFDRRLSSSLQRARDGDGAVPDVLLLFDLDRFKIVNDTCGHAAGDAMLCAIAAHLGKHFDAHDTFARLGGDEFGVLLGERDRQHALALANTLLRAANTFTYQWETQHFETSLSIGMLVLNEPGMTAEAAMRMTDIACFVAKERGRDRLQEVDLDDGHLAMHVHEASWAQRLKQALEHDLFCLYAQPIRRSAVAAGRATGMDKVELLVRMIDADGGPDIAPGNFIPAAERYGLMTAIDQWVVQAALRTLAATPVKSYGEYAINLSGASVGNSRFLHYVIRQLAESGVDPRILCFEITETAAIGNLVNAAHFMKELDALGCRFALDDFGSGMSSFGYLKHLPVDYLKIDGGFVKSLAQDPVSREMVAAINDIGHSLGCETIAEYVESEDIVTLLQGYGVDYLQGYAIGRPAPWMERDAPRAVVDHPPATGTGTGMNMDRDRGTHRTDPIHPLDPVRGGDMLERSAG